jgi:hypothetical protein
MSALADMSAVKSANHLSFLPVPARHIIIIPFAINYLRNIRTHDIRWPIKCRE